MSAPQTTCTRAAEAARDSIAKNSAAMRAQLNLAERGDMDGIHELRVASRRMVAVLEQQKGICPGRERAALRELTKQVTRLIGRARELDVMIAQMEGYAARSRRRVNPALQNALAELRSRREQENPRCADAVHLVRSAAYTDAEKDARNAVHARETCWRDDAARRLRKPHRKLRHAHKHWRKTENSHDLHAVRIALKKFRYACEQYEPLYGPRYAAFIRGLKRMQDRLGHWNDCRILSAELRGIALTAPAAHHTGIEALAVRVGCEGERSRDAFERAATRFFTDERRAAIERLFARPAAPCCAAASELLAKR